MSHGLHAADGGVDVNLIVPPEQLPLKLAEAATLPKVPLTDYDINWLQVIHLPHISPISPPYLDYDINWLQVIGEGWAAPLKGFMREGALVQQLWFNSMLVDEHNHTGMGGYLDKHTNWMQARGGR